MEQQAQLWTEGLGIWQRALANPRRQVRREPAAAAEPSALAEKADRDRRFAAPEWRDNPLFDTIRQTYLLISERLLGSVDAIEGVDAATREKLRFDDPRLRRRDEPLQFRAHQSAGAREGDGDEGREPADGLQHMLSDLEKGQLTHVQPGAFEVGRNIAITPGKVVKQTELYQLIQYAPATGAGAGNAADHLSALDQPLLHPRSEPKKSFIKWAVDQGLTGFVVVLEVADEKPRRREARRLLPRRGEAIDAVRDALGVECVHAIGYCVAGTMLAATLALLESRGEAEKVASATFFTARSISPRRATSSCSSATSRWS